MSNELILREDNVRLVMTQAPQAWRDNQESHDRCLSSCRALLDTIEAEGMTDELDQQAETYIRKSRNTVKKMNENRSSVTKLFDEIRAVFTTLENEVDPAKKGSIPYLLQEQRNAYAAKKQREAEAAREAELQRQRQELMRATYRQDVEADYRQTFNSHLNRKYNQLADLLQSITLENFDVQEKAIRTFPAGLPDDYAQLLPSGIRIPAGMDAAEAKDIRDEVMAVLLPQFREQYAFDIGENKASILAMLPGKRTELEAMAKLDEAEAARRAEAMKQREAEEAAKREQERLRREQEEAAKAQARKQQAEMAGLFDQAKNSAPSYQPKAQVRKRIVVTDPRGFLDILNLWWTAEGVNLTVDELAKKFKTQLTLCEKLANDKQDPSFIQSPYIRYEDEVKAK